MSSRYNRNYLLKDTFQTRFIVVSMLHFLAVLMTFLAALFLPIMIGLDNLSLSVAERGGFANQFLSLHERLWVPITIVLTLLILHAIFFSHKIAGPLYRFRKVFQAIGDGNLGTPVVIRQDDYLHKETELLNQMVMSLQERVLMAKGHYAEVQVELEDLKAALERGAAKEEMAHALKTLEIRAMRLKTELDSFRVTRQ